ncbi:MAG TPA: DNA gyrase C-terminal beta-propeller domain-containing protein [Armatimonadota bacterium]|nr:DNA gyrase C-terminal beta-propeller domain-containing protein [Armatimonadota bacterium]
MANAVLVVTENGIGKVTCADQFQVRGRGGKGVTGFNVTEDSGEIAAAVGVTCGAGESVLILTAKGMALRISVDDITTRSRTAGGVKLITLADDDEVEAVCV